MNTRILGVIAFFAAVFLISGCSAPETLAAPVPPSTLPKPGEVRKLEIAIGVEMEFCWVPPGQAQLGSPKAEREAVAKLTGEKEADLSKSEGESVRGKFKSSGFWLGKYEVTQAEWKALMGSNPSVFNGKNDNAAKGMDTSRFPVEAVSRDECQKFLEKLNVKARGEQSFGKKGKFVLPHEDEWEYACRGGKGNGRAFYWGDELNGTQANCWGDFPFGTTTKGKDLERTAEVGSYAKDYPHPWGLCDMHGNVWEWCENIFFDDHYIIRGGSWNDLAGSCRAAMRAGSSPRPRRFPSIGLRVCFRLDEG